ncbi:subtilisin-like protease SBT3.4 [Mangifera indica]|uniref:subtilisin-like protease SBT3.4 n=1 Tax=Mangifera indica TaxID=29780 RepID=UPI001CF99775|nr:subtilisin-like protease SBT3.4 [Mangifera indica]
MEGSLIQKRFSPSVLRILILLILIFQMADSTDSASAKPEVHIVYMQRPEGVDPEAYDIQVLSSVLGSEHAAKEALLYSYNNAASGFSASLTPKQVEDIKNKEGVLSVAPSRSYQLHEGAGNMRLA